MSTSRISQMLNQKTFSPSRSIFILRLSARNRVILICLSPTIKYPSTSSDLDCSRNHINGVLQMKLSFVIQWGKWAVAGTLWIPDMGIGDVSCFWVVINLSWGRGVEVPVNIIQLKKRPTCSPTSPPSNCVAGTTCSDLWLRKRSEVKIERQKRKKKQMIVLFLKAIIGINLSGVCRRHKLRFLW